ncbi:MAG: hypothetical protein CMM50_01855 [Rhodospirillaceae bacterium]|nr:hypothetical protein [Rhodospirillaceae bacterium]
MTAENGRIDWPAALEAAARGIESLRAEPNLESEAAKDVLRRRAQTLARHAERRTEATGERKLVLMIGESHYALPLLEVAAVAPLNGYAPIPGAPSAHLGVTSLRGDLWAVFDAARLVGESGVGPDKLRHVVLLRGGKRRTALAVGELVGVRLFPDAEIRSMTMEVEGEGKVVQGWTPGPIFHVDVDTVMTHPAVTGEGR